MLTAIIIQPVYYRHEIAISLVVNQPGNKWLARCVL